eukprot:230172-Hanusia_phi.AAC.2
MWTASPPDESLQADNRWGALTSLIREQNQRRIRGRRDRVCSRQLNTTHYSTERIHCIAPGYNLDIMIPRKYSPELQHRSIRPPGFSRIP